MKLIDKRKFTLSEVMFLRKMKSEILAKKLGVSKTTILKWIKNPNMIKLHHWKLLLKILEVDEDEICL